MRKKKISCIFCTRPIQIINALSIVRQFNLRADLYIIDQFSNAKEVADRIRQERVFENTYYICEKDMYKWRGRGNPVIIDRLLLACTYINIDKIVESFFDYKKNYETMYISSKAYTSRLVMMYLLKKNFKTEFILFDDGIGSYCNPHVFRPKKFDEICRRLFVMVNTDSIHLTKLLYAPAFYSKVNPGSNDGIRQLMKIGNESGDKKLISRIFDVREEDFITDDIIYFCIFKDSEIKYDNYPFVEDMEKEIIELTGAGQILMKPHPGDSSRNSDYKYYEASHIPFEALCMSEDFSDKLLITNISTAAFTPKLLFDQEPKIIFLYDLLKDKMQDKKSIFNKLIKEFKNTYSDQSKIAVPSNLDDLRDAIQRLI